MTEREIRKRMEEKGLSDLWWSYSNGEKASTARSLLSIVEEFEDKVAAIRILHDSEKEKADGEWLLLEFAGSAPTPPVSSPDPSPSPKKPVLEPTRASVDEVEADVWLGNPSQWLNVKEYGLSLVAVICGLIVIVTGWDWLTGRSWAMVPTLLLFFVIPLAVSAWKYLETRNFKYELTDQRLKTHEGVLNKKTDTLELYRVKDTEIARPFWLRLIGRGNIILHTSDRTTPTLVLKAIAHPASQVELIRNKVERLRESKRVREMDFSGDGEFE